MTNELKGRELDAAVATEILKWKNVAMGRDDYGGEPVPTMYNPRPEFSDEKVIWMPVPPSSTDISAALPVLDKVRKDFFSIKIIMWDHTDKVAIVGHKRQGHNENIGDLEVEADTLPLAICDFTLKAVEE